MKKITNTIFDKCIICLENNVNSFEHIIPKCIGGRMHILMLCNKCNNEVGSKLVSKIQHDPSIRIAIRKVKDDIPHIYEQYENGQIYIAKDKDNTLVRLKYKNNKLEVMTEKQDDGSMIIDENKTNEYIIGILGKDGFSNEKIEEKLQSYNELKSGDTIKLSNNLNIAKKRLGPVFPDLRGDIIDEKLFVLMAYEYMALLVGKDIYNKFFDPVRGYILGIKEGLNINVKYLCYRKYGAFHKMYFEMESDCVIVNIVLFGNLLYKVKFDKINIKDLDYVYIEDIKNSRTFIAKTVKDAKQGTYYEAKKTKIW